MTAGVATAARIGFFSAQKLVENTKRGQALRKRLEAFQRERQAQLKTIQENLKRLQKEIQSAALDPRAREEKAKRFQLLKTRFKRSYEDAQREFQRTSQRQLRRLERALMPLIQALGKRMGFPAIFDTGATRGLAYFDSALDVTSHPIRAIDARYPN